VLPQPIFEIPPSESSKSKITTVAAVDERD
jgi:hypothetical protein